jgi:hypothetical protein
MGLIELSLWDKLKRIKADKVVGAVEGNFAKLDANGNLVDSGHKDADYEDADVTILKKANVVDGLDSEVVDVPLSANQGRVLDGKIDTNRLYSDQQYIQLKEKADALQVALTSAKAELYTDDPILQYAPVEVLGKGYDSLDAPVDVSANVVDGSMEMEQKGLTITNLVENGNFTDGLTGWSMNGASLSLLNNILSITGTGVEFGDPFAYHTINKTKLSTSKYYIKFKARVTNSDCSSITLRVYNGISALVLKTVNSPVINQWYVIDGFIDLSTFGIGYYLRVDLRHSYGAYLDIGKVMEVDGNYGVSTYNLTALGLDHITDTNILQNLLPYVDGTKSVPKFGMRVVWKNLFDGESIYRNNQVNWYYDNGVKTIYSGRYSYTIKLIEGKTYTITKPEYRVYNRNVITALSTPDAENGTELYNNATSLVAVFTVPSGKPYINFWFTLTESEYEEFEIIENLINTMLNYGSTALPYVPYQEQLTFLPAIGNRVPNGTADSIKTVADGWEHTKRVKSFTITEDDVINFNNTAYSGIDLVYIKRPIDMVPVNSGYTATSLYISGYSPKMQGTSSSYVETTYYGDSYFGSLDITIRKTPDVYTDLADAKSKLAGTVIYYELATPITTHYDLPLPTALEGGTIQRFAGEEKIALYGTGVTFDNNVLSVISAVKFVAGEMTDITNDATITGGTVTFSGVSATDVVYIKVENDVDMPLGVLEHTPPVSNTASRLVSLEARVSALEVV